MVNLEQSGKLTPPFRFFTVTCILLIITMRTNDEVVRAVRKGFDSWSRHSIFFFSHYIIQWNIKEILAENIEGNI